MPQRQADHVPGVRGQSTAVPEKHGRTARIAPVQVTKPNPVREHLAVLGQDDLSRAHTRLGEGRWKVRHMLAGVKRRPSVGRQAVSGAAARR